MNIIDEIKARFLELGYRIEISPDGQEEHLIRPNGTLAAVADYHQTQRLRAAQQRAEAIVWGIERGVYP